jgi:hypothetical protein
MQALSPDVTPIGREPLQGRREDRGLQRARIVDPWEFFLQVSRTFLGSGMGAMTPFVDPPVARRCDGGEGYAPVGPVGPVLLASQTSPSRPPKGANHGPQAFPPAKQPLLGRCEEATIAILDPWQASAG